MLIMLVLLCNPKYRAVETLRTALAMGADSGIHIVTETRIDQDLQPLAVAKIFQKIV
jgi:electron transfer flavoprotein beta subunit